MGNDKPLREALPASIGLFERHGVTHDYLTASNYRAILVAEDGDPRRAARLLAATAKQAETAGILTMAAITLLNLAEAQARSGDVRAASKSLARAKRHSAALGKLAYIERGIEKVSRGL